MATIEDVARMAGVSIATVSRAIHHPGKVAETTRKKVNAAIAKTGFTANAMAQSLRSKSSKMILAMVPDISNTFFANILLGLEAVATRRGYGLLIGNTENDPQTEATYLTYTRSNKADGIVLMTGHLPFGAAEVRQHLPPIVAACEEIVEESVPFVGVDNQHGARTAVHHLVELGHRRIAYISGPPNNILSSERRAGYELALRQSGLTVDPELTLDGDFSIEGGRLAVERLFIRDALPTAFFCANDDMAIGVLLALSQRGYNVPRDFSVIGFDDIPFSSCTTPPLTTIRQPRRLIGEAAMTKMLDMVEGKPVRTGAVILPVELIIRGSTGAPREIDRRPD
ncbi:LacI family transcriptional regulator [Roseibium polysiphoniae]|uniref:LacI family transcriptional regulator n=1 Tax=Roseibium polysiphoniae TaxID=2571221 RepID=A0A944CAX7_9HYPH|nr:LacI family DNA-binding transcriptional regulator [Roseibium polysiphoniae]MBS8259127.1 LacI family transcriptional regulator [Roseibium polysiphoniae]